MKNTQEIITEMQATVDRLNEASQAYYGGKDEIMSNLEWDKLFDKLKQMEKREGIILPNSPTQTTGFILEGADVTHEHPALSLAKTKDPKDVQDWTGDKVIHLSIKNDGASAIVRYRNGKLCWNAGIATRGNGQVGKDITHLAEAISGIPSEIPYKGDLEIRGEIMVSYPSFNGINSNLPEEEQYSNPRNLAAGSLALDSKNLEKAKERELHFQVFTLVSCDSRVPLWSQRMLFLEKMGFDVVPHLTGKKEDIPQMIEELTKQVKDGTIIYPADGLVAVYEDTDYAATGSVTGHHATRAGLAFKWADKPVSTILREIQWSCGATVITPVAVFDEVLLEGTKVKRASMCNLSELKRLGIGENGKTVINVIKSNMIIPKVAEVTAAEGTFTVPSVCPVCGGKTEIVISTNSGCETLRCTNDDCCAKKLRLFEKFVSRSGMDIDGLSTQTLRTFISLGYIHDFSDIYELGQYRDKITVMDGFGIRSFDNLMAAIEKSRSVWDKQFIYALNIPMIGHDASKKIIDAMDIDDFISRLSQGGHGFESIDGMGPEKATSIATWCAKMENQQLLQKLLDAVILKHTERVTGGKCQGVTFVITGKTHHFPKRDDFIEYVVSEGGKVAGSVSKNTDFLVNNDSTSTTGKNKKANELGITIMTEDEFIAAFKED